MTASDTLSDDGPSPKRASDRPLASRAMLFTLLECERLDAGGSRHLLDGVDEVWLGRGVSRQLERDGARLMVRIPDRFMSARHARITRDASGWTLRDEGSMNGVFLDGERVVEALVGESLIELGHTFFLLSVADAAAEPLDFDTEGMDQPIAGLLTLLPSLAARFDTLARLAPSPLAVLLLGETGTGKEVLARALHRLSGRPGAFVAVNCGAIADTLIESELFGHARGAYSGAVKDTPGLVKAADRGTLFLDEIGDLSPRSQAALLRVIQEREVLAVGTTRPVRVDVRVVAATHRPLDELAARGEFRSDLHARLAGLTVLLPALRERREDLGVLVSAIVRGLRGVGHVVPTLALDAGRALALYDWPHNVRELVQALEVAITLADDGVIQLAHLPLAVAEAVQLRPSNTQRSVIGEADPLRTALVAELEGKRGNVSEVARSMGKARMQIHRWMRRYGLNAETYRKP